MKKILFGFLTISLFFFACKKDNVSVQPGNDSGDPDNDTTIVVSLHEPGYGPSVSPFKDPAWTLPAGIELSQKFHQYMYCATLANTLSSTALKNFKGVPGGLFLLCFTLHNSSNLPITVVFPEELAIYSSSMESQNGLLIDIGEIIVPANSSLTLFAGGFCINKSRSGPDVFDDNGELLSYSLGPASVPAALREITDIVREKHIQFSDVVNAAGTQFDNVKYTAVFVIQKAIWEVTDGEGLTEETKTQLENLAF